jgi:Xaa-Pro dipeptidase
MAIDFSNEEYQQRLEKVREHMAEAGLDAIILTRPQNIFYLNAYRAAILNWTSVIVPLVVPLKGDLCFMTRILETDLSRLQLAKKVRNYMDHEDPFQILYDILKENGITSGNIGLEEAYLNVKQFGRIKELLPHATFKDVSGFVDIIRMNLSKNEVEYFKRAAEITNIGFQSALNTISEGVYLFEIIGEIHKAMYKAGQTDVEISKVWLWCGPSGGFMHDTDTTHQIARNDLATIEVWGTCNQYFAGAQGSVYIGGTPSPDINDSYKLVAEMYQAARDAIRPGAFAGEVYEAANKVYRSATGENYWRRIGTNMGLTFGPIDVGIHSRHILQPWTPFIIQPLLVSPVLITCCSTLLLTDTGVEELTPPLLELKCLS